jgi:hypothetical protein
MVTGVAPPSGEGLRHRYVRRLWVVWGTSGARRATTAQHARSGSLTLYAGRVVGLLAVDVTAHGVVMSADSQPVEIVGTENRVLATSGWQTRTPIVVRVGGGFVGLVGYVGTEQIDGVQATTWLSRFSAERPADDLKTFCEGLVATLTGVWQRDGLDSVLEILVTGEVSGDLQFWFVRNSRVIGDRQFNAVNDLDLNYIPAHLAPGETKPDVLARVMFSFRQGVLFPASPVFDGFSMVLGAIYAGNTEGFEPLSSLDDVGHYARVRMEFLKRLCTAKYGIFKPGTPTTVAGDVHVLGVGPDGRVAEYRKHRNQTRFVRAGRT